MVGGTLPVDLRESLPPKASEWCETSRGERELEKWEVVVRGMLETELKEEVQLLVNC